MVYQTTFVSPSIQLSSIQTNAFKTGVISFTLTLPLTAERDVAGTVLAGVLRRGTEKYPTQAHINRALDELYASCVEIRCSRIGNNLSLVFSAEILDQRFIPDKTDVLGGVIEIVAQILLHPITNGFAFSKEFVEREIVCVCDSIHAQKNNTRAYAAIRCSELMHRDSKGFPTLAMAEDFVRSLDEHSLYDYYQEWLRLSPMDVFYIGNEDAKVIGQKINLAFSKAITATSAQINPLVANKPTAFCSVTEQMPVNQGKLSMGFRVGVCASPSNDDYYTALVFNELFGASPASKLFMNVREKMSLCYYCSSSFSIYTGNLMVSCGMEVQNRKIAEEAILDQLQQLQNGEISDAEFSAAKKSLENCYRSIEDNPFDLQSYYGGRMMFGISDSLTECRAKLAAVSREAVIDLAKQVIHDTSFFVEGTLSNEAEMEDDGDDE